MPWPLRIRETPDNTWPKDQQIGDTFKHVHTLADGSERTHWYVVLPNRHLWSVYGNSADGTPWDVTGEIPNITVRPSIFPQPILRDDGTVYRQGWHGYITNGLISDDLEGRTYP